MTCCNGCNQPLLNYQHLEKVHHYLLPPWWSLIPPVIPGTAGNIWKPSNTWRVGLAHNLKHVASQVMKKASDRNNRNQIYMNQICVSMKLVRPNPLEMLPASIMPLKQPPVEGNFDASRHLKTIHASSFQQLSAFSLKPPWDTLSELGGM